MFLRDRLTARYKCNAPHFQNVSGVPVLGFLSVSTYNYTGCTPPALQDHSPRVEDQLAIYIKYHGLNHLISHSFRLILIDCYTNTLNLKHLMINCIENLYNIHGSRWDWKTWKVFQVREKSRNFDKIGKVRDFLYSIEILE